MNEILELTPSGLYCNLEDFYIDPRRSVKRAVITHAHADHARWGSQSYLCAQDGSFYGIAGHLHPAVTVTGKGRLKETLPCFCFGPRAAILPAFGSFTGTQLIRPTSEDRIYVVAGDEVVEMQIKVTP